MALQELVPLGSENISSRRPPPRPSKKKNQDLGIYYGFFLKFPTDTSVLYIWESPLGNRVSLAFSCDEALRFAFLTLIN